MGSLYVHVFAMCNVLIFLIFQANVFRLLEFVVVELGYIPTDALTSVGLLLEKRK